jgi:hypothetical protein
MLTADADIPERTAIVQEQRGQRASLVCEERRQLDPGRCAGAEPESPDSHAGPVGLKIALTVQDFTRAACRHPSVLSMLG